MIAEPEPSQTSGWASFHASGVLFPLQALIFRRTSGTRPASAPLLIRASLVSSTVPNCGSVRAPYFGAHGPEPPPRHE